MTNPKVAVLSDRFDRGAINSNLWTTPSGANAPVLGSGTVATVLTPSPSYAGISFPVSITMPALVFTGASGANVALQSVSAYDLTGSGLSVELISYTAANPFSGYFGMGSGSNQVQWFLDNSGNLDVGTPSAGYTRVVNAPIPLSTYRFLRIRESSGTVYFDYSADGISWTNASSMSDPFDLTAVYVSLGIQGSGSSSSTNLVWANLDYVL